MSGNEILNKIKIMFNDHNVTIDDIKTALDSFPSSNIFLIGDFIIDIYTFCEAIGKTSKTPTLSVKRNGSEYFWGGAGLFATNFNELKAKVEFLTIAGNDWGSEFIKNEQQKYKNIKLNLLIDESRPTTLKERFWVDGYKLLQVDTVDNKYISDDFLEKVIGVSEPLIAKQDVVLISDPRHGLLSPDLIKYIKAKCKENGKSLIVDTQVSSRSGNVEEYIGVDMICVNETEARYFLRDDRSTVKDLLHKIYEQIKVKRLILKLGLNGLIGLDDKEGYFEFPAIPVKTVDPIGSGDAFLSAAVLSYKPNVKLLASIFIATCAGSLSVTKMGTIPNNIDELTQFINQQMEIIFEL